ncbi:MAG: sugar ABC transporter substrate-binding protein [Nocardioidaceae bacterium]
MTRTTSPRRLVALAVSVSLAFVVSACSLKAESGASSDGASATPTAQSSSAATEVPSLEGKTIGISAKDVVHEFSRSVYEAAQARVKELGGKVIAVQAEAKDDQHISDVENLISQKPDAIIVILGDAETLEPTLEKVREADIPLFTVDYSSSNSINNVTSNNWQIGTTTAITLAESIGGKGKILVFNGFPGVAPCRIRYNQLKLVLEDYPKISLLSPELQDKYEGTIEDAKQQINAALQRYPKGEISAIWSCWDLPQIGAAQAVDAAGRDEIKIFGVDAESGALDLIADPDSSYYATIAQQSAAMGSGSVDNVALYLGGEEDKVTTTTYFEPILITKDNVEEVRSELGL